MTFWVYRCPVCGLEVRTDHQTVQHQETKACACEAEPEEREEKDD